MSRHRAAWLSVVAYAAAMVALLGLVGCVNGEPFSPEMCVVVADSLTIRIDQQTLQRCASPRIRVEVKK